MLTRRIRQGSRLFLERDKCEGAWILLRGKVALSMHSGAQQVTISYAKPGAILGLAETLVDATYRSTAVAASDVTLHFVPKKDVLELIKDDSATAMELLQLLSENLHELYQTIKSLPRPVLN